VNADWHNGAARAARSPDMRMKKRGKQSTELFETQVQATKLNALVGDLLYSNTCGILAGYFITELHVV
jgi:hypothetical protein